MADAKAFLEKLINSNSEIKIIISDSELDNLTVNQLVEAYKKLDENLKNKAAASIQQNIKTEEKSQQDTQSEFPESYQSSQPYLSQSTDHISLKSEIIDYSAQEKLSAEKIGELVEGLLNSHGFVMADKGKISYFNTQTQHLSSATHTSFEDDFFYDTPHTIGKEQDNDLDSDRQSIVETINTEEAIQRNNIKLLSLTSYDTIEQIKTAIKEDNEINDTPIVTLIMDNKELLRIDEKSALKFAIDGYLGEKSDGVNLLTNYKISTQSPLQYCGNQIRDFIGYHNQQNDIDIPEITIPEHELQDLMLELIKPENKEHKESELKKLFPEIPDITEVKQNILVALAERSLEQISTNRKSSNLFIKETTNQTDAKIENNKEFTDKLTELQKGLFPENQKEKKNFSALVNDKDKLKHFIKMTKAQLNITTTNAGDILKSCDLSDLATLHKYLDKKNKTLQLEDNIADPFDGSKDTFDRQWQKASPLKKVGIVALHIVSLGIYAAGRMFTSNKEHGKFKDQFTKKQNTSQWSEQIKNDQPSTGKTK